MDAEIKALIGQLKGGIDATAVGIFDGARASLRDSSEESESAFWATFNDIYCLQADWGEWDRALLDTGTATVDCRCGAHSVQAFLFNSRWILIVLAGGPLITGASKVIEHALHVLRDLLPAGRAQRSSAPPAGGGPGGGGQGPAELAIPVSWIRKRTSD